MWRWRRARRCVGDHGKENAVHGRGDHVGEATQADALLRYALLYSGVLWAPRPVHDPGLHASCIAATRLTLLRRAATRSGLARPGRRGKMLWLLYLSEASQTRYGGVENRARSQPI